MQTNWKKEWNRNVQLFPPEKDFRRFKLKISYDGTDYWGWQRQSKDCQNDYSIQSFIERAVYKISKENVTVFGSGRTDSGVHAICQVAHFDSKNIKMNVDKLRLALNANLPFTIRVNDIEERFDAFHSRYSTYLRQYIYIIRDDKSFTAFDKNRVWNVIKYPNIDELNKMAGCIIGENMDFTSFDFTKKEIEHSSKRDVLESRFYYDNYNRLVYTITANAFLYHMVRALVGSFVKISSKMGNESFDYFKNLINSKKRYGFVAPSSGLYLNKIIYDKDEYDDMLSRI